MKIKKSIGVIVATSILLVGCNNDKDHIQNYNDGLEKIQKAEQPITEINEKLGKLEKEKERIAKKIENKDIHSVQDNVKEVLKNTEERNKEIKKEKDAMSKSQKEFNKIKGDVSKIEDKDKKKEFDEFNKAMDTKYQKHEDFVKGYQNILNKEKDLFEYFTTQSITQEEVNRKSKAVVDAQKQMKGKVDQYSEAVKKARKEKSDIDQFTK